MTCSPQPVNTWRLRPMPLTPCHSRCFCCPCCWRNTRRLSVCASRSKRFRMTQTNEVQGWLLDLYPNLNGGITFWLMAEDGRRYQLYQDFPVTFYVAGKNEQLRQVWQFLKSQPVPVSLDRTERRDLFSGMLTVMVIEVKNPADQPGLFAMLSRQFPDLTYYDSDLPLSLRH